ncbi:hypothetical protein H112_05358 [Trichophyton rubrum D6]|nr:hypothetical protein H112_05358 [Trichophyton rubrum D6]
MVLLFHLAGDGPGALHPQASDPVWGSWRETCYSFRLIPGPFYTHQSLVQIGTDQARFAHSALRTAYITFRAAFPPPPPPPQLHELDESMTVFVWKERSKKEETSFSVFHA